MLIGKGDVGPALTSLNSGLIYRELWLYFGSDYVRQNGSEEAAKAGRELERSQIIGELGPRLLRDPDKEIDGWSQDQFQEIVRHVSSVGALCE